MTEKKQRGKNFSTEEELLLVDLVTNQKHILENKKSDAVNWRLKNEAWMQLEESFKSQSGVHRPWKALRDKYDNIKRKAKMELASEKLETYRTGGGTPSKGLVSAVSEKVLAIVGNAATGLNNPYDNDKNNDANNNNIHDDILEEEYIEDMDINNWISEDDFPDIVEITSEDKELSKTCTKPSIEPCLTGVKVKEKVSKELFIPNKNKKTSVEEEKIKLLKLQQAFYVGEDSRAAKKHKMEMKSMKLKNKILALELKEKRDKLDEYM